MPPTNIPRRPLGRGPGAAPQPAQDPSERVEVPAAPAADTAQPADTVPSSNDAPGEGRPGAPDPAGDRTADPVGGQAPDPAPGTGRPDAVPEASEPVPDAGTPTAAQDGPDASSERLPDAGTTTATQEPSGAAERDPDAASAASGASGPDTAPEAEAGGAGADEAVEAGRAGSAEGAAGAGKAGKASKAGKADVATERAGADSGRFTVRLVNFEGPFDLLLQLISKHKLDVTEVALSRVTDEFMAHIRAMGPDWDLDQTTEFLVVAATLLDLKAARLLPAADIEDEADLALLEARDLLFARLLQYRAYKQVAAIFAARLDEEGRRYPRTVGLEPGLAELLPDVVIRIGPEGFARLAVKAMQPKPEPQVYVDHIHAPLVSVQEQAQIVVDLLRERGRATFLELTADTDDTLTVVARFLALLELYRARAVGLDQEEALGALVVHWTGGEDTGDIRVGEFDLVSGTGEQEEATA